MPSALEILSVLKPNGEKNRLEEDVFVSKEAWDIAKEGALELVKMLPTKYSSVDSIKPTIFKAKNKFTSKSLKKYVSKTGNLYPYIPFPNVAFQSVNIPFSLYYGIMSEKEMDDLLDTVNEVYFLELLPETPRIDLLQYISKDLFKEKKKIKLRYEVEYECNKVHFKFDTVNEDEDIVIPIQIMQHEKNGTLLPFIGFCAMQPDLRGMISVPLHPNVKFIKEEYDTDFYDITSENLCWGDHAAFNPKIFSVANFSSRYNDSLITKSDYYGNLQNMLNKWIYEEQ